MTFDRVDIEQKVCVGYVVIARNASMEAPACDGCVIFAVDVLSHVVLELSDYAHCQRNRVHTPLWIRAILTRASNHSEMQ